MPRVRPILLSVLLIASYCGPASAADPKPAPDWSLEAADGSTVSLAREVQEQTTIMFFWATWCPYCKALMPHLQSIRLEYGEQVKILAINIKEDADPFEFMTNAGYDFVLLPEGEAVADLYDVRGTPGVFVVDAKQNIRFDLSKLPRIEPPDNGQKAGHSRRAAFRAPYWAAEIRKSLDAIHNDGT